MAAIFTDENQTCQIDVSSAIWATDQLNKIFSVVKDGVLFDVDFIIEEHERLLFVEIKNANFFGVKNPEAFNPNDQKRLRKIAHKYFDSFHYVRGLNKTFKQKIYIYLVEFLNDDSVMRKSLRIKLKDRLPFKLQELFSERMIDDILVLNFDEWNEQFPQFPLLRLKPQLNKI